jgi:hypothetical protein
VGFTGNIHYVQVADFFTGLFGVDLAGDDGRVVALWPWEEEGGLEPDPTAVWAREEFFGESTRTRPALAKGKTATAARPAVPPAPASGTAATKPVPSPRPDVPPLP